MNKGTNTNPFENFKGSELTQKQAEHTLGAGEINPTFSFYSNRETTNYAEGSVKYLCYGNTNGLKPAYFF